MGLVTKVKKQSNLNVPTFVISQLVSKVRESAYPVLRKCWFLERSPKSKALVTQSKHSQALGCITWFVSCVVNHSVLIVRLPNHGTVSNS